MKHCFYGFLFVLGWISSEALAADWQKVEVFPPDVNLTSKADFQHLVVLGTHADGTTEDLTEKIKWSLADASLAAIEGNRLSPLKDGSCKVEGRVDGQKLAVPLTVSNAGLTRETSFRLDVVPVLTREGCNTGECHGAARGQDGFMLSLFGFDPEGDYFKLTREMSGRRINLAIPEESLLIEKSIESVPHTGGKRFKKGSTSYQTLVDWVSEGAPNDPEEIAEAVGIDILPEGILFGGVDATQQMTVRATYSDGSDRDVTHLSVFSSTNDPSVSVDTNGKLTAHKRGESFVMARFHTYTVGTPVLVIPAGLPYEKPEIEPENPIDEAVFAKLHRLRIEPSELSSDAVFLRRVMIDLAGRLPEEDEVQPFLENRDPAKRAKLIDKLIASSEFTDIWTMKWSELLKIKSIPNQGISVKATLLYNGWVREQVAANRPMDEMVRDLLTSEGSVLKNPPTNFYQVERDNLKLTEDVAQVFMGMRLQCAQCHNHPFDRWTMDDYYGFAAFFAQVGRKKGEDLRDTLIYWRERGDIKHPVTKKNAVPRFLGGGEADTKGKPRQKVLADWLASPENPWFAKNLANITWAHFFGMGIVEPVDDVRVSNPASNEALLEVLADQLTENGYDLRDLVKSICNSRTYQLATATNASNKDDLTNFSHGNIRRMRAEVLEDVITKLTNSRKKHKGLPLGATAVQIQDGSTTNYFLKTFGRSTRTTVCSCEVKMEPNLGQALHLINGEIAHNRITNGKVIPKLLEAGKHPEEVIERLYMRALTRAPSEAEMGRFRAVLAEVSEEEHPVVLVDIFWAILNSKEFIFNH